MIGGILFVCAVVAGFLALVCLRNLYDLAVCVQCGGRGRHRRGCPLSDE